MGLHAKPQSGTPTSKNHKPPIATNQAHASLRLKNRQMRMSRSNRTPFKLRPYQERMVKNAVSFLLKPKVKRFPRLCIKSPTGSGKTAIAIEIIRSLFERGNHSALGSDGGPTGQVIILFDSIKLLKQAEKAIGTLLLANYGKHLNVGVDQGGNKAKGGEDM